MKEYPILSGTTALVTGGGTGIGRAISIAFARQGCKVVISYNSSKAEAEETVALIGQLGGWAAAVQADVTDEEQVIRMVEATLAVDGKIDILVNNAGSMVRRSSIDEMELSLWRTVMDVNLTSVFLVSKYVSRSMKAQKSGRIIHISSIAGRNGGGNGAVAYGTAKGAVMTFNKGLAKELAPFGILVNAIAPGVITTRFHDEHTSAEARKAFTPRIPLQREGTPDEVAAVALFLASDMSGYITGEMIEVNGGMLMD